MTETFKIEFRFERQDVDELVFQVESWGEELGVSMHRENLAGPEEDLDKPRYRSLDPVALGMSIVAITVALPGAINHTMQILDRVLAKREAEPSAAIETPVRLCLPDVDFDREITRDELEEALALLRSRQDHEAEDSV